VATEFTPTPTTTATTYRCYVTLRCLCPPSRLFFFVVVVVVVAFFYCRAMIAAAAAVRRQVRTRNVSHHVQTNKQTKNAVANSRHEMWSPLAESSINHQIMIILCLKNFNPSRHAHPRNRRFLVVVFFFFFHFSTFLNIPDKEQTLITRYVRRADSVVVVPSGTVTSCVRMCRNGAGC
jgi:hypothetical protein